MRPAFERRAAAALAAGAFLFVVMLAAPLLDPAAAQGPAPAVAVPAPGDAQADAPQGRGGRGAAAGGGQGRGRGPVDTLGEGPWDIQTETGPVRVSVVTRGVERPWGLAFLPDGDMLVTERSGRLRLIRNGVLDPTPLGPLPKVYSPTVGDLAGLFDIVLHPRFEQNRLIYFVYSKPGEEVEAHATTAIARARYDGGTTLANLEDIFVADAYHGGPDSPRGVGPSTGSFGARLVFDDAGYLYVSLGERNLPSMSQDPMTHGGKILRLRDDGSTPDDNPFVGREGYLPEIYTLGHRNPLGLTIHPVTREMWSTEFGPRGGDELNRIVRGGNYGWYLMSHGTNYDGSPVGDGEPSKPGFEDPVLHWSPVINPGNLLFYYGDRFPAWRGNMLMAAMARTVLRVTFDENGTPVAQERMLTELKQRFRDIRLGPDGNLYVLTDENFGAVLRIEPGR